MLVRELDAWMGMLWELPHRAEREQIEDLVAWNKHGATSLIPW